MKSSENDSLDSLQSDMKLIDVTEILYLANGEKYVIIDFIELNRNGFREFKHCYRSEMYTGDLESLRRIIHKAKAIANFLKFQVLLDLMEIGKQLIISNHKTEQEIESHLIEVENSCDIAIKELELLLDHDV